MGTMAASTDLLSASRFTPARYRLPAVCWLIRGQSHPAARDTQWWFCALASTVREYPGRALARHLGSCRREAAHRTVGRCQPDAPARGGMTHQVRVCEGNLPRRPVQVFPEVGRCWRRLVHRVRWMGVDRLDLTAGHDWPVTDRDVVAELRVDTALAEVFVEGWQSWSPATTYRLGDQQHSAAVPEGWTSGYGGTRPRPPVDPLLRFQAEGLMVIDTGLGEIVTVGATDPTDVPTIRCWQQDPTRLLVTADGPHQVTRVDGAGSDVPIAVALAGHADRLALASEVGTIRQAPTIWCSWYQYFTQVTEPDMVENIENIDRLELPVDVIQLDDGYQAEIGDWTMLSSRFRSLPDLVARIRDHGRRTGIWIAPFLVGEQSETARTRPDWIVRDADGLPVRALHNWDQDVFSLDLTHPDAAEYVAGVFRWLTSMGIDFFKIDFLYAAALNGVRRDQNPDSVEVYRRGLDLIRESIGPTPYLLGCGAPLIPSVGKVDAMRISADTDLGWAARDGDFSLPGGESAELSTIGRGYQHGRYWANDPDCLLVRPGVEQRERRAALVARYGGLRGSSDRIADLDDWGLSTTRALLSEPPASNTPFVGGD